MAITNTGGYHGKGPLGKRQAQYKPDNKWRWEVVDDVEEHKASGQDEISTKILANLAQLHQYSNYCSKVQSTGVTYPNTGANLVPIYKKAF